MVSVDNNEMAVFEGKQDEALCPHCLAANDPKAHFCYKCGTPMSSYATIDPIGSIWATGDTYRKATSRPTRPIILVGMWLIFGVPVLCYVFLVAVWKVLRPLEGFIWFGVLVGVIVLYVAILLKTTKNYFRQMKFEKSQARASENDSSE